MTSLAFMFVEVPAPPWIMSTRKLIVQLAGEDFVASGCDGVGPFAVEHAEFGVGQRRGFLHEGQRADEVLEVSEAECRRAESSPCRAWSARRSRRVSGTSRSPSESCSAPVADERRRAAAEPLTGRAQPRAEAPRDVADDAVEDFRFSRADFVENLARNLPDRRAGVSATASRSAAGRRASRLR